MKTNNTINTPIAIGGRVLENAKEFNYLGSKLTIDSDCSLNIDAKISKTNKVFTMLKKNIWRSPYLESNHTKIPIFKSNLLSILLYGSENDLRMVEIHFDHRKKLDIFQIKKLRRILKIFWPNIISNEDLLARTRLPSVTKTIQATLAMTGARAKDAARLPTKNGSPKDGRTVEKYFRLRELSLQCADYVVPDRVRWRSWLEED